MTIEKARLLIKLYRVYIVTFVAAVLLGLFAFFLFRGFAGRHEVGDKLNEIRQTAAQNERRADEILDAAKQREEAIKHETSESVGAVSDDGLPAVLSGLLSDYRKERGGR